MARDNLRLTAHQQSVVVQGVNYLKGVGNRILLIQGSAGTGKTTLVKYIVEALTKELSTKVGRTYSAVMTAPTNKAVEVLRDKSNAEDDIYSEFCTLHSALRLKYSINEKTGIEEYLPDPSNRDQKLTGATLLVVDEASMIGSDLLHYIDRAIELNDLLKVIYIGDIKQLPPVNEMISPVFAQGYKYLELHEIIRQSHENPIIQLSSNIYQLNSYVNQLTSNGHGYSFTKDMHRIIHYFASNKRDTDIRFLAYTNRRVDQFNAAVRREIFHQPRRVEEGETIIFDRPYQVDEYTRYTNNEEVLITSTETRVMTFSYPIDKDGSIRVEKLKEYWVNDSFPILHEESDYKFADIMEELRKMAIRKEIFWKDYFTARDNYVAFKHRYAITVHKAQGSTYREVFLDYDDVNLNHNTEERARLIYTAITRASERLTVVTNRLKNGR